MKTLQQANNFGKGDKISENRFSAIEIINLIDKMATG